MKPSLLTIVFLTGNVRSRNLAETFMEFFGYGEGQNEITDTREEDEESSNSVEETDERYKEKFDWWKPVEGGGFVKNNEIWENPQYEEYENEIQNCTGDRVWFTYRPPHDPRTEEGYLAYMKCLEEWLEKFAEQDHGYGTGDIYPSYTQDLLFGHDELK